MINLPIKVAIHALWPEAEGVADLAGKDRAGLIVESGHDMQDRGCLLQRILGEEPALAFFEAETRLHRIDEGGR